MWTGNGVMTSFEIEGSSVSHYRVVAKLGCRMALLCLKTLVFKRGNFAYSAVLISAAYGRSAWDLFGARRVVLDTIEALFGDLPNPGILRAEIRLFDWLKQKGLTAVITAERDQPDKLTRHGIEEFVSDCVILLDHRIREEILTRRLHIIKYRGSTHGTNEYPFLIDDQGISVLPISSLGLDRDASTERVSSGVARLDGTLGGKGFYRGSSILPSWVVNDESRAFVIISVHRP